MIEKAKGLIILHMICALEKGDEEHDGRGMLQVIEETIFDHGFGF